jgi:hypothetical protein
MYQIEHRMASIDHTCIQDGTTIEDSGVVPLASWPRFIPAQDAVAYKYRGNMT